MVSGLPGVGKSRLVAEAVAQAVSEGWVPLQIRASAGLAAVPFGALRTVVPVDGATDLAELAATLERSVGRGGTGGDQRPSLVVVDDAHSLDDMSAGLVHHLVAARSVVAMVTVRTGSERPAAVTALWKDDLADRMELHGLSLRDTASLVGSVLGGPVEESTVERLYQVTSGNPLYLRELILSGREVGALQRADTLWRWRGNFAGGGRLREIVGERLGRLRPNELACLELLAVARSLPFDLLAEVTGAETIEHLEARAIVVVERSRRRIEVSLAHPLHGEVLRGEMTPLQERAIRRNLMAVTARAGGRRTSDRVRLACWSLGVGSDVDPVSLTRAADVAFWQVGHEISARLGEILPGALAGGEETPRPAVPGDPDLAIRLAETAYRSGGGIEAGAVLATTLCCTGATKEAAAVLAEMQDAATTPDDRLRLALALAEVRFWGEHRTDDAMTLLREAAASPAKGASASLKAEVAAKLAGIALNTDRGGIALDFAIEAAHLAGEPLAESMAAPAAAASLGHLGRCAEALDLVDAALSISIARNRHALEVPQLLFARTGALGRSGRLQEACELAEMCRQVALSSDSLDGAALFGVAAAEALLRRGRPASAARLFRDSVGLFEERDVFGYQPWALTGLARARAWLGQDAAATRLLEQADEASSWVRYFDVWRFQAHALVHRRAGRTAEAVVAARAGADWAARAAMPVEEALLVDTWLRLEPVPEAASRIEALTRATDSQLVAALAEHATALVEGDLSGLVASSRRLGCLGANLMAAEAAGSAALGYLRRHDERAARSAERLAFAFAAECEGARSPVLEQLSAPVTLTKREIEIAQLASGGQPSKVIAARLHLSTRTVDSHLYRVYTKLGVSDRAGLASVLSPRETAESVQ